MGFAKGKFSSLYRAQRLQWLQGDHTELTHDVMLMVLIQPNCPGCIHHCLPVANEVASSKNALFDVYCVSTAFEDFEYNTVENTMDLLQNGKLHGASAKALGPETKATPTMPVAYDHVVDREDANEELKEQVLSSMIANAREQLKSMNVPEDRIEWAMRQVGEEALPEKLADVFWSVQAQGTPTWVVHRDDGELLGVKFGFMDEAQLRDWVHEVMGAITAV